MEGDFSFNSISEHLIPWPCLAPARRVLAWAGGWQSELPLFSTLGFPAAASHGCRALPWPWQQRAATLHAPILPPRHRAAHACATAALRSPRVTPCRGVLPVSPQLLAANGADPGAQHPTVPLQSPTRV